MIKKCLGLIVGLLLLTGCSEFALLSSGSSLALSNNVYAKAYSGVDLTTYLVTDKGIKTHAYEYVIKAKEVKDLVIEVLAHDFSERKDDHIKVASSVEIKPDESIILASTKHERPCGNNRCISALLSIVFPSCIYCSFINEFIILGYSLFKTTLEVKKRKITRERIKIKKTKRKIKKKKRK